MMANNSAGAAIIKDVSGNSIFGYCYANTGFWAGHGERSFGGTLIDKYGIKRLSNYESTEIGPCSEADNTAQGANNQGALCTLLFQNGEDIYTVSVYIGGKHVSTESYSGSFDGIGAIQTLEKQYLGVGVVKKSQKEFDAGNGGNRSVCIQEMEFKEDGSIGMMEGLSLGLGGTASQIRISDNRCLGHVALGNTQGFVVDQNGGQGEYKMDVKGFARESGYDTQWEIVSARYVPEGEDSGYYVSIQSANVTGYFIKTEAAQTKLASDNMDTMGAMMSYKTVKALDGSNGVSFESVAFSGRYLAFVGGKLITTKPVSLAACSFTIAEPGTGAADQEAADNVAALINKIGNNWYHRKY